MGLFDSAQVKKEKIINGLLNSGDNHDMVASFTTLQNEIGVKFNTKVVAITSIKDDELAAAFAKGFANAFATNGSTSLIIDGNLYNPCLGKMLNASTENSEEQKMIDIDEKTKALCLNKEIYPSEAYKNGVIQKIIEENKDQFEHFIILVPAIKEHKEIVLLNDILESVILVTQKNVTIKEHIFNAVQYCSNNNLPLAKTVVLK